MANEQNLIPNNKRSPEEVRENGRKGGINSGKARRDKADLKKVIQAWMEAKVATDENGKPLTGAEYMTQIAVREMEKGSAKHWELMRDSSGQKPIDRVVIAEVDQSVIDEVERAVTEE